MIITAKTRHYIHIYVQHRGGGNNQAMVTKGAPLLQVQNFRGIFSYWCHLEGCWTLLLLNNYFYFYFYSMKNEGNSVISVFNTRWWLFTSHWRARPRSLCFPNKYLDHEDHLSTSSLVCRCLSSHTSLGTGLPIGEETRFTYQHYGHYGCCWSYFFLESPHSWTPQNKHTDHIHTNHIIPTTLYQPHCTNHISTTLPTRYWPHYRPHYTNHITNHIADHVLTTLPTTYL